MSTNIGNKPMLFGVAEAAKKLGISKRTLWKLTDRGFIKRIKIGSRVLYDPDELRRFIERQKEVNDAAS